MIIEKTFDMQYAQNKTITPLEIENFIKSKGIEPCRYAILEKNGDIYKISVSGTEILKG